MARLIDMFLNDQPTDIQAPEYGQQLNDLAINRPFKSWDYELSDPQWRRWFDRLKENNVSGLSDASVGVKKGMQRPSLYSLLNQEQGKSF